MLEKSCGWWLIWYFLFFCHGGAEVTKSRPYIDPSITQSSKVMSPQGQPLVINCGIDGFPKPLITWYKSLEVMAPDNRVSVLSNGSLHFMRLTTGDQGYYYCDGKNYLGQVRSAEIFVEVAYINLHFEKEPDSQYIIGKSRTLPCSPPASHPPANVTWYKDNQPIKYRTGEHVVYILDPAKSIWDLFFTDIQKQDEGRYFCIASNNFAVPMSRTSKSADVQIEGQLQWVVKEKVTDYGQNLTLFCPVENCCSKRQAGWFVGGKSKILDVKTFSNDPNSKYHGTYNTDGFGFVIRNLSEADLNVFYHCNYGFNQSIPTLLLHGDVFKENVPDKDKDKENDTVAENNTVTIVLSIVVPIAVIGIVIVAIIVYRRKNKKPKSKGTKIEMKVLKDSDNKAKDQPGSDHEKQPLYQQGPPTVKMQQPSHSITAGNKVTLVCTVSSTLNIHYVLWRRNFEKYTTFITFDTNRNKYHGSTIINPSLTILKASSSDAGNYTCFASSDVGIGQSTPTTLSVTENSPTVEMHQQSHSVTIGNDVTLVCTVISSLTVNNVQWQRNKGESRKLITSNPKKYDGFSINKPSLTILNASSSDAGTYTCFATNIEGTGQSTPTTLNVTENPPTVKVEHSSYSVTTGKDVTLVCTVSSSLRINNVQWRRNIGDSTKCSTSNPKKYDGGSIIKPSLTILNASPSDAGTYTCCASSEVGTGGITTTTLCVTESPPTVEVQQSSYSVTTGKKVTLGCTVSSRLDINNIEWERNIDGSITLITSNTNIDNYSGSTTTTPSLTILNASPSDAGTYTCCASSDVGTGRSTTTTLSVTESPPTVEVQQSSYSVTTGKKVTLGCTVSSRLDINNVEWERNIDGSITLITSNTNIDKYSGSTTTTPSLTILNASSSDVGTYTCCASSNVGTGRSPFTVLNVTERDFHGAIVEKYRTKPKIPKDLLDDKTFLSKLLEECGKNTEGLYTDSSGGIDVYFPATLLVVVMKYRPETEIVKEVLNDMSTTLTSQSPSPVVIVYHRSVKTAMEKVYKDCKKPVDKEDCEKPKDKEDGEKPIVKEDCEKQIEIFRKFIEKHKFDYSASSCLQQCIYKSRQ